MGMLSGLDDRPAWSAKRIGHETIVKADALLGNPVQVGGRSNLAQPAAIGRYGLVGMIVGKNENDIGPVLLSLDRR